MHSKENKDALRCRIRECGKVSLFVFFKLKQAKLLQTSFYKYTNMGSVINTYKNTSENIKCLYWIENQYATIFHLIPSPMLLISSLRCCCQLGFWELVRVVRIPSPLPHFPIPCPSKCHPPLGCRVTYPMSKQMSKPIDRQSGGGGGVPTCAISPSHSLGCKSHTLSAAFPDPHPGLSDEGDTSYVHGRSNFCFSRRCKL